MELSFDVKQKLKESDKTLWNITNHDPIVTNANLIICQQNDSSERGLESPDIVPPEPPQES